MKLEYKPWLGEVVEVASIAGLMPEQLAAITAPFDPRVKPSVIAPMSGLDLTADVGAYFDHPVFDLYPFTQAYRVRGYRLKVFLWVKGGATFAPRSYKPTPGYKTALWRLTPGETGAVVDDDKRLEVDFGETLNVVRLKLVFRGLFDPSLPPPP